MESETKNDFLRSLEESLAKDLDKIEIENKQNQEKIKAETIESVKKQLNEIEKKIEQKLKGFYYWLFGTFLTLLIIIIGVVFYLRSYPINK